MPGLPLSYLMARWSYQAETFLQAGPSVRQAYPANPRQSLKNQQTGAGWPGPPACLSRYRVGKPNPRTLVY